MTVGNYNHSFTFLTKFLLVCLCSWANIALAQERIYTYTSAGIAHLMFKENLNLSQNISRDSDFAAYRGTVLQVQKQSSKQAWGFSMGGLIGLGRAVAAGQGETLFYSAGTKWTLIGITPKVYYRISRPVALGITAMGFVKNISWPDYAGVSAESKHSFNFAFLGDLNINLGNQFELTQSVGSINGDSSIWKIGLNYRFE